MTMRSLKNFGRQHVRGIERLIVGDDIDTAVRYRIEVLDQIIRT